MVSVRAVNTEDCEGTIVTIQCEFITDSNAQGCMVVLVGEFGNTTVNLTRNSTHAVMLNTIPNDVFGFDIESDGSIRMLPVPGVVRNASLCVPSEVAPSPSSRGFNAVVQI